MHHISDVVLNTLLNTCRRNKSCQPRCFPFPLYQKVIYPNHIYIKTYKSSSSF